jgi:hypothetical protein
MILTGFQLRASRQVLNLTLEELHKESNVSKITLSRLENTISNLEDISCSAKDAENILSFFSQKDLSFNNKHTIALKEDIETKDVKENITRFQFIVARTILQYSQREISKYLRINYNTVHKLESFDNKSFLHIKSANISDFICFFAKKNISFPDNLSVQLSSEINTHD